MSDKGVRATDELGQVIRNWPPLEHNAVLSMIEKRTRYFRHAYKEGGSIEFLKGFYEAFDEIQAERVTGVSCKKGCHLCCRINVTIWKDEAALIAEYCREHDISIPRAYLEEQLKYGWKEVAATDVGWCVFLKNGECSIYPVRPLGCRKYHVSSPPELCDTVKYPSDKGHRVAVAVFTFPEIDASAFYGLMAEKGKSGRLPEMLLPYSK